MIEQSGDFLPLWMLISAGFGFIVGEVCGDLIRHRKCLQAANNDLRDKLQKPHADDEPFLRELRQIRKVINDVHKRICAVTKGSEKPHS